MNNELKEPAKWELVDDTLIVPVASGGIYITSVPQIVVNAHNLAMDTLYKQAILFQRRAEHLDNELNRVSFERDKLQLELAQLRELIEQDAKARERQGEAERKVGGM